MSMLVFLHPLDTRRATGRSVGRVVAAVRVNQIDPQLAAALIERQWALRVSSRADLARVLADPDAASPGYDHGSAGWIAMDEQLATVYTSVLAEEVAAANQLQPTTDQPFSYAVASNWKADRIAAALLDEPGSHTTAPPADSLPETLGFLALNPGRPRPPGRHPG
jgi:hypothetical protein